MGMDIDGILSTIRKLEKVAPETSRIYVEQIILGAEAQMRNRCAKLAEEFFGTDEEKQVAKRIAEMIKGLT